MKFDANIISFLVVLQSTSKVASFSSRSLQSKSTTTFAATFLKMASTTTEAAASSTSTSTNPFLQQKGLPKFESIEPEYLSPAVEELLEKLVSDFCKLEEDLEKNKNESVVDYEKVLPVVERMQFPLGYVWGIAGHLNGVKNGDELREAYESNQPKVVESMTKFSQSKPLYDALSAIQKQWDDDNDNNESKSDSSESDSFLQKQRRRALENSLLEMKLGGVGLEGADKERFNEIKQKLAKLSMTFSNNVLDDTKAFSHVVQDAEAMEGVPESAKAQWAQSYLQSKKDDDEKEAPSIEEATAKGPWRITLDIPSYLPAMSHLGDRGIRELLYKAYVGKAAETSDGKNNVPLIYEILTLKQEMARLLGFTNYADLSLAKKMAPGVESVNELSDLMAEKAVPAAQKELEEVTALARDKGGDEYSEDKLAKLAPWDVTFWVRKKYLKNRNIELPFLDFFVCSANL